MNATIYESLDALLDNVAQQRWYHRNAGSDFFGADGTTMGCVHYMRRGASEWEQKPTLDLMDKIDASAHDRQRREYVASPVGAFPVVAEFLQGLPQNMRRRQEQQSDQSPIRIVVETLVSAGVKESELVRRGAAVAALVMRMNELRPVELWASWGMRIYRRDIIGRVKLDTAPISLANVVAVMATPQFCRGVLFTEAGSKAQNDTMSINWAFGSPPNDEGHIRRIREILQLDPQDIYLPGGFLTEATAFMRDPVAWVNSYVDPQRELE